MAAEFAAAGVTPGQPFPGNVIPDALIDPNATAFLGTGAIPLPNFGNQFTGSRSVPIDVREEIIRVDHNFNDRVSLMAHFINDAIIQETDTTLWGGMSYPTLGTIFRNPAKSAVLRLTWTISPSLLNEVAYNYNGNRIDFTGAFNAYELGYDRSSSDLDRRHVLTMNYIYELPFFKSHSSPFVRQAVGGWQLSGITNFQTGLPNTPSYPGDIAGVGFGNVRPNVVSDPNSGPKTLDEWFNTDAFAPPDELTFGNAGRNVIRRPGRDNWNISVFKVFSFSSLREGAQLQFRLEMFNTFNHTQFSDYDSNVLSGNYGKITSTYDARRIQFGLKFAF
ncbi:MAG TPA: hypothetical protein VM182_01460 [Terriglobia bacterium]|nr:hypothetical protein [Terriglobia bacterium]